MTQGSLLDPAAPLRTDGSLPVTDAALARDETEQGIAKAQRKLESTDGAGWKLGAFIALAAVARRQDTLTGDDVWQELGDVDPRYGSQMGVVFRFAQAQGVIESTGRFVESQRPSRHRNGIRVWRSKVRA